MNKTWKLAAAAALWGTAVLAVPATAGSLDPSSVSARPAPMVVAQAGAAAPAAHAPGAPEAGHGPEGGESHGGFPPFKPANYASQLIWLIVSFGALYFLMSRVTLPRIGRILEERHDRIAKDLEEARLRQAESEAAHVAYEKALTEARGKANAIAGEARNRLTAETDANRKALEASLNTKLADAESRIAATKTSALSHVRGIAVDTTNAIVTTLVGAGAPQQDVEAAVDAALAAKSN
ncbi:F0F1 ATP synthase subunit B [Azorhizobium doebereinerae]|uniref:F0F1 ATP synthase subunit B n=1 Tax=Azorhizobium doebereinerae TaxID=281091 RepID=UPI00040F39F2|nr:F0F1 ATP synthase subunit B [Azorhizobium doebereinerae]